MNCIVFSLKPYELMSVLLNVYRDKFVVQLVRKDIDIKVHDRLFNITLERKFKRFYVCFAVRISAINNKLRYII